jgi:serine/threonine-protein phosphatase PPG1
VLAIEKPVLQISSPLVLVGDIHGQFFDLCEIFKIAGKCPVL